jgi:hypothetical protein
MSQRPAKFRLTAVKLYFTEQARQEELRVLEEPQETRHGQGQPKGSRNIRRPKNNKLRRSERYITAKHNNQFITAMEEDNVSMTFLTRKEQADIELSVKLRKDGVITTPGGLFERSQRQEINGLIAREVFEFVQYNLIKHSGIRIFNSRLVNKIKGKAINTPFKKSRLIVQAYNNKDKELILT